MVELLSKNISGCFFLNTVYIHLNLTLLHTTFNLLFLVTYFKLEARHSIECILTPAI